MERQVPGQPIIPTTAKFVKNKFSEFIHDEPGQRFRRQYHKKKAVAPEHPVSYIISLVIGDILIAFGLATYIFILGIPGFVIMVAGLIMLACRGNVIATLLDHLELRSRPAYEWLRRKVVYQRPSKRNFKDHVL